MSEYDKAIFSDAIHANGTEAVIGLYQLFDSNNVVPERTSVLVTMRDQHRQDFYRAQNVTYTYRSVIESDIHPDLLRQVPVPEYLTDLIIGFADSLVQHQCERSIKSHGRAIFPPDASWLKDHISMQLMALPVVRDDEELVLPLFESKYVKEVTLALIKSAGERTWSLQYICQEDHTLLKHLLETKLGEVTIVHSLDHDDTIS